MFAFPNPSVYQASKCFFTYGTMSHPDPKQLPSKKPWAAIQSLDFIHTADLILPQECYGIIEQKLLAGDATAEPRPQFQRVIMTLGQILEAPFFKEYVKISDILMLSEGRPGQDNVFTLREGKLTMFLDRETYERAGIVGKPHGVKGKRGLKPRWIVEFDLKADSSWPGKKGFDRLLYACKNVLNSPCAWLFCNMSKTPDPDPLVPHFPTTFTSHPVIVEDIEANIPPIEPPASLIENSDRLESEEFASAVYEWLSLVRLQSPRIESADQVDPYISCYRIPGEPEQQQAVRLCRISWQGFLSSSWARMVLADVILTLPPKSWFSMSLSSFSSSKGLTGDGSECTVLRPPKSRGEYLLWEVKTHE